VRLNPLGMSAAIWPTSTGWLLGDDECKVVNGIMGRGNHSTRRKPAPVPICPPQIPHDLNRARTPAAAVGSRRLTTWAIAASSFRIVCLELCR
jgi:hypothetical protein